MDEDLFQTLLRFHREVVVPDIERIVAHAFDRIESRLKAFEDRMNAHFEAIDQRFERLAASMTKPPQAP